MPDQETWKFINSFAPWLSGLGSLTAVIVSLWLAQRPVRTHIQVMSQMMHCLGPDQKPVEYPFALQVRAVNHGFREVKINGVRWALWGVRVHKFFIVPQPNPDSTNLPVTLKQSEDACFYYPTVSFTDDARVFLEPIKRARFKRLSLRRLRVGVYTSTGEEFLARLHKTVRDWLALAVQFEQPAKHG